MNYETWGKTDALAFFEKFDIHVALENFSLSSVGVTYNFKPLGGYSTAAFRRAADWLKNGYGYTTTPRQQGGFSVFMPKKQMFLYHFEIEPKLAEMQKNGVVCPLVLGNGENGFIKTDIDKCTHILIAGTTGSGKSCLMNSLICQLFAYSDAWFGLIDPKGGAEFGIYDKPLRFLLRGAFRNGSVATDSARALSMLRALVKEMDKRYRVMNAKGQRKSTEKHIIVFVDELADLMMQNKEIEEPLVQLAQKGRAANINLILATQDPRSDVVTGLIKYNMPTKICLKTANAQHSRNMLDRGDAAGLFGNGDAYVKLPTSPDLIRAQCPYISDEEIKHILRIDGQFSFRDYLKQLKNN